MDMFLSYFSAADYWEIPNVKEVLGLDSNYVRVLDYTVSSEAKKYKKSGYKIHVCQMKLPKEGIVNKNNILVASPELVFLQLSSKISLQRLILLGLQLCSFPPGNPKKSITTKKKLQNFINKTPGHMGQVNSQRALRYIEGGSASIMESLAYMILTLPNLLGGYGLGGAVFNYEIKLKREADQLLRQKRCFVDIYYKRKKVGVEYDSFSFHNSPKEQGKDAIRSETLGRLGFELMHLSTIQLYNIEACDDFATNLGNRLGRRINIRTKKYEEMRNQLRELLPCKEKEF